MLDWLGLGYIPAHIYNSHTQTETSGTLNTILSLFLSLSYIHTYIYTHPHTYIWEILTHTFCTYQYTVMHT